ncbi:ABC transporter ATP-binding protein [Legionella micdadei]|uniref:Lipopolysaccharide transport system ATP-binding protein n=1 Tax=Legionella micdadei TaxID=451 RepID=A0A098GBN9_LEGMI|nr:ABC transporter ATP-binding protein [Legionella micdadei]ARG96206.1 ABC transporter ATP-binding protein [Legionella micdadei]KTD29016.1 ABC transporter of LPS O-antigen [Legionella micdadei]CEG59380.1 O-antigen export system ATP-binding protein rfbE [Legionella micdadei]SCY00970.1 lipopolysaccharide transport system ATP-binding protein [Legionella micdadei]
MASIEFNNVSVDFPIYNTNSRSLKKRLMQVATGGQLDANGQGVVVVRALENLTFSLKDGDRVGLIGHNGAGKSTLLRLLSGVYEPSCGTVRIKGEIGSLIDISLGIDSEATGRENIYVRGGLLGLTRTEIKKHLDDIIEFSELGNFIDVPVRTYSTGMHLRLAFAVSTILRPEILVMDEWLSVGDENFKRKAEKRMTEVVQATNILIIASHSPDLILNTCNRAIWLEHGKIKMDSAPHSVVNAYFGS